MVRVVTLPPNDTQGTLHLAVHKVGNYRYALRPVFASLTIVIFGLHCLHFLYSFLTRRGKIYYFLLHFVYFSCYDCLLNGGCVKDAIVPFLSLSFLFFFVLSFLRFLLCLLKWWVCFKMLLFSRHSCLPVLFLVFSLFILFFIFFFISIHVFQFSSFLLFVFILSSSSFLPTSFSFHLLSLCVPSPFFPPSFPQFFFNLFSSHLLRAINSPSLSLLSLTFLPFPSSFLPFSIYSPSTSSIFLFSYLCVWLMLWLSHRHTAAT